MNVGAGQTTATSHGPEKKEPSKAFMDAKATQKLLVKRLEAEGEDEIAERLSSCGKERELTCTCCGATHEVETRCRKKWCPVCCRRIAAERSLKFERLIAKMKWPLFVTLTMKNVDDLSFGAVRSLRRAFGKLRRKTIWTRRVVGGVASIEVTNIGNGWHPHLHAVVDCEWLAVKSDAPKADWSRERKAGAYKRAAKELEAAWAKCLGQPSASVKVKRVYSDTVAKEVAKYSVKGSDLVESAGSVGDLIRALEGTRLVTTFGTCFGAGAVVEPSARAPLMCQCGASGDWLPTDIVDRIARSSHRPILISPGTAARRNGW